MPTFIDWLSYPSTVIYNLIAVIYRSGTVPPYRNLTSDHIVVGEETATVLPQVARIRAPEGPESGNDELR